MFPSQAELLKETERLKARLVELEGFIHDYVEGLAEEADFIRWAIKLRDKCNLEDYPRL